MNVGSLKEKISFISYTSVEDLFGGTTDTPTTILTTFAAVSPLRGTRALSFNQMGLYDVSQFNIRWRENFSPTIKMKIQWRGNLYTIHESVELQAAERYWQILAYMKQQPYA
jgi:SPP1 family predicted phage head-tail adaptor